ncbi:MAG: monocarboxylate uptake permease MctP [Tumebacillaceae bacterium]
MNWTSVSVFALLFLLVTVLGFWASKWRQGNLNEIDEWGLGGRRFGTIITWFLLGGDLYTAYTFIAVPGLMYGTGAYGFYAVPYTIIIYPFVFMVMPRLWLVSKNHGYVTASDFIKGRYDSKGLALAVAITGILATLPYIALQLVGMQAVIGALGFKGEVPLFIAFAILAAYTYTSGLRAPAVTAVVKDLLIYITVIVAIIVIPMKLGGFSNIFHAVKTQLPNGLVLQPKQYVAYATLSLGSALALFLYPHSLTGVLSSSSEKVIKRNSALLPLYSFALGIIALLGFMAIAAGIKTSTTSMSVPLLIKNMFPDWFVGVAFAAIAIGALVPASIMLIAAANLFTRNIYREYFNKNASTEQETKMAKLFSLLVKAGAIVFVIWLPSTYAINLQLLGGIWILQTFPAIIVGLYTTWFHKRALLLGWIAGMAYGTWMAIDQNMKSSIYPIHIGSYTISGYAAIWALVLNFVVAFVFTLIFRAMNVKSGVDQTRKADYEKVINA